MIYLDSRYVDGTIAKVSNARKNQYDLAVFRQWPSSAVTFFFYEWVDNDRLDNIAMRFLGNSAMWWQILDINPEILNPTNIAPGTQIRIPNA